MLDLSPLNERPLIAQNQSSKWNWGNSNIPIRLNAICLSLELNWFRILLLVVFFFSVFNNPFIASYSFWAQSLKQKQREYEQKNEEINVITELK